MALPVVHGSVEYTTLVRRLFLQKPPVRVFLELPETLSPLLPQIMPHLSSIPVVSFEHESGRQSHMIFEPLEPLVEALRSAHESNVPYHLIDVFEDRLHYFIPEFFPDTYALREVSPVRMFELYENSRLAPQPDIVDDSFFKFLEKIDEIREIHMARMIRSLSKTTPVSQEKQEYSLLVCGIKHMASLIELCLLSEEDFEKKMESAGHDHFSGPGNGDEEPLETLMKRMDRIDETARDLPAVISILSRESPEVLSQPGYYNAAWLIMRKELYSSAKFNRILLQRAVYRETVNRYERESGELFPSRIEKIFFRFARNWSLLENRLLPDVYKLVMSARGFGNDNFARIMFDVLNFIPPLHSRPFPEIKLTLDDMYRDSRLIRFRLKLKRKRKVPPPPVQKRFRREKYPGEWSREWTGGGICSYPPEDIIIEDFGRYLQKRASSVMKGMESRSLPFTSSLLDGIDYRETVRNLSQDKIFVREITRKGIEAGSGVIIFSESEEEHSWKAVWWGEHSQESDMAFYATPPENIVGPGVCRCQYGGLMLTYPPGRLHDIWTDEAYQDLTSPADRLLAAAIEFNEKNAVVHLSQRPPSPRLQQIAGRMGQKIVHIPLTTINSVVLGRVRRFHVLDSRQRRDEAGDYIW